MVSPVFLEKDGVHPHKSLMGYRLNFDVFMPSSGLIIPRCLSAEIVAIGNIGGILIAILSAFDRVYTIARVFHRAHLSLGCFPNAKRVQPTHTHKVINTQGVQ